MTKQVTTPEVMQPLRIVIAGDTFSPDINGAARFTERLAAGLALRGHQVHIIAPASSRKAIGAFTELIEGVELTVHRLPSWRFKPHEWLRFVFPWVAYSKGKGIVRQLQPDVIHTQSHILIGRAFAKIAQNANIRLVSTNHVMPENIVDLATMPGWLRTIIVRLGWIDANRVLSKADAVTTPTGRAAAFLERETSLQEVLAISCGLESAKYTPDLTERKQQRIVFVGRMTQEKHVDVLIRALALLPAHIGLDLVGPGDQIPALKELASKLHVADRVIFHGKVSDEQLRACLTQASVFAIASEAELQSIATLEAMASGLPIVAADAMALPHLVQEGKNGYLFQPRQHAELAAHIERILALPHTEFVKMQQASLAAVQAHDINRTLATFEQLYRGQ